MTGKPPRAYQDFVKRFPKVGLAWDNLHDAERDGPLDEKTRRLVKLAVAVGAKQQGAVSSGVRKGLREGLTPAEMEQVAVCAASTIGLPAAVAAYGWILDAIAKADAR